MIAQNFQRKGLAEVIAATASIAGRSGEAAPMIVVLGKDNSMRGRLQARRLGIENRIVFAGESKAAADFYAAADFFVLPTRHDSCSLVVLESLAMGLPVISTVFNGACEAMTDGVHGYVLEDPTNVSALADAMTRLLDPTLRTKMRQACLALRPRFRRRRIWIASKKSIARGSIQPVTSSIDPTGMLLKLENGFVAPP